MSRAIYLKEWRKRKNPDTTERGSEKWRKAISEATKKAMQREDIKKKISKPKGKASFKSRIAKSRALEGKYPKNYIQFASSSPMNTSKGWIELGGKKFYSKSMWERNYARYLQFLKEKKEIKDWEYEPKVFIFEKIQFGNRTYRPDFKVTEMDDSYTWHEVKGWMDPASNTKLKRMAKYFPDETVIVIKKDEYMQIRKDVMPLIKDWEKSRYA